MNNCHSDSTIKELPYYQSNSEEAYHYQSSSNIEEAITTSFNTEASPNTEEAPLLEWLHY